MRRGTTRPYVSRNLTVRTMKSKVLLFNLDYFPSDGQGSPRGASRTPTGWQVRLDAPSRETTGPIEPSPSRKGYAVHHCKPILVDTLVLGCACYAFADRLPVMIPLLIMATLY